jgi:hypothetical protein
MLYIVRSVEMFVMVCLYQQDMNIEATELCTIAKVI